MTPATSKGQSRKPRAPAASEPDSSENEGTTSSTTTNPTTHIPSVTRSSTNQPHSPSPQLEKSDRISKEKQKFFRLSAIFADKKRAAEKKKVEAAKKATLEEKKKTEATKNSASEEKKVLSKTVNSDVNKNKIDTGETGKRVSSSVDASKRVSSSRNRPELETSDKVVKKCESKCNTRTIKNKSNNKLDVKNKEKKTKPVPSPTKTSTPLTKNKIISKTLVNRAKKIDKKPVVSKPDRIISAESSSDEESVKKHEHVNSDSSLDSSECSTSSSDDSSSMESDSDSSAHPSETSRMSLSVSKLKSSSSLFVSTSSPMSTFGSISGINNSKDSKVWGFAAAAAEANRTKRDSFGGIFNKNESKEGIFNKNESKDSFASADDKTSTSTSTTSEDKSKPGFGQLKGLFDGLSHLFTTSSTRSRTSSTPNYNPTRRKRPSEKVPEKEASKQSVEPKEEKRPKVEKEPKPERDTGKTGNKQKLLSMNPKPESAVGIASVVTKQSNITIPPKIPKRITPTTIPPETERKTPRTNTVPEDLSWNKMSPSKLVKTAVNSKRHELERRNFLKGDCPSFGGIGYRGFSHSSLLEDVRMKKRNLIAEATQTNHPLSVPQPSNNQPGKMGHRTHSYNYPIRIPVLFQ